MPRNLVRESNRLSVHPTLHLRQVHLLQRLLKPAQSLPWVLNYWFFKQRWHPLSVSSRLFLNRVPSPVYIGYPSYYLMVMPCKGSSFEPDLAIFDDVMRLQLTNAHPFQKQWCTALLTHLGYGRFVASYHRSI